MTDDDKTFAELLHAWKDRTGISNERAGELFEMSDRTFKRYLAGTQVPHRYMQERMLQEAAIFEASIKQPEAA